jgi:hypothetical protein
MSDIGLHSTIYDRLRRYGEAIDDLLIELRSDDETRTSQTRNEVTQILTEMSEEEPRTAPLRFMRLILLRSAGLQKDQLRQLADDLSFGKNDQGVLAQLERIAVVMDSERATTLSKMRGR